MPCGSAIPRYPSPPCPLPLRILFLLNAFATVAAALVLFLAPNLIPAIAGAALPPESLLVARLLGAYEAGLAVLCTGGLSIAAAPSTA